LGVALGRTCAVLAPGADAAVLAIVVPRGMRPRRTAGAAKQRGAEQRQRRHVAARMRSTTVRVDPGRIFLRAFLERSSAREVRCVGVHHKPLFQKAQQTINHRGNAHRCEYKFCTSTRVGFLTILHSTVLSDTTSRSSILSGQSPATASL